MACTPATGVVQDAAARRDFPDIRLISYQEAVAAALGRLTPEQLEPVTLAGSHSSRTIKQAGFLIDLRQIALDLPAEAVWRAIAGLGGKNGWLYLNGLWHATRPGSTGCWAGRGCAAAGRRRPAPGLDRRLLHRRRPRAGRHLRLRADLKAPGLGWMEWRVRRAAPRAAPR